MGGALPAARGSWLSEPWRRIRCGLLVDLVGDVVDDCGDTFDALADPDRPLDIER